jgi:regulator of sigma E protease
LEFVPQLPAMVAKGLGRLVTGRPAEDEGLGGPLRMAEMFGEAARWGVIAFLVMMANISTQLAIFNLLPIPLLDGGGILMLLVEMLMQRDLSLRVKEAIVKVGFAFLMVVIVFVIYNDISKIIPGGGGG